MATKTDKFFELVERTFDVDEITPEKIMDEFYRGTSVKVKFGKDKKGKQRFGKSQSTIEGKSKFRNLAEILAEGREVVQDLQTTTDFDDLRVLRRRANELLIHSKEATKRVQTKMDVISKELVGISQERKERRLAEEAQQKQIIREEKSLDTIISRIPNSNLGGLSLFEDKLDNLQVDTFEARGLINERIIEIEEEKIFTQQRQEQVRLEKEALREQGVEPDF